MLPGFEQSTLSGLTAPEGPVDAVLVRKRCASASTRAVLYIHGYVDYFFQTHLADFYNAHGWHFYALDLRRHGRALRACQLPNFTSNIDEYLQDVDAAIQILMSQEGVDGVLLNGHSTGGLVAALYAHRGPHRAVVKAVFLNSPFLDMNLPAWQERFLEPLLAVVGRWLPKLQLPALSQIYGQSLHATHHGPWHYNTQWKPIAGFPVYAGWFRAIHLAHAEIERELSLSCPVLVLHAQHSAWPKRWYPAVSGADIVLDVADMKRLAPGLGHKVTVRAIAGGMHDLTLANPVPRAEMFDVLRQWLCTVSEPTATRPQA